MLHFEFKQSYQLANKIPFIEEHFRVLVLLMALSNGKKFPTSPSKNKELKKSEFSDYERITESLTIVMVRQ